MQFDLQARKFFGCNEACQQRIFCERLPEFALAYAHQTVQLNAYRQQYGWYVGGELSVRLVLLMGIQLGADAILPRVRKRTAHMTSSNVRVVGVDDFAFRRGDHYGTDDVPETLPDFFGKRHTLNPNHRLFMLPTDNSPLWGDAAGAMTVTQTLAAAGTSFQVLPERVGSCPSLRRRNVMLLGAPEYSPIAAKLLAKTAFTIDFLSAANDHGIVNHQP